MSKTFPKNDDSVTEEEIRKRISSLDLSQIKKKIMQPVEKFGYGWTQEKADAVEEQYRGFLFVMWKYPNEMAVPSADIDVYWHTHILFTEKYKEDCDYIFGQFIHHNPQV